MHQLVVELMQTTPPNIILAVDTLSQSHRRVHSGWMRGSRALVMARTTTIWHFHHAKCEGSNLTQHRKPKSIVKICGGSVETMTAMASLTSPSPKKKSKGGKGHKSITGSFFADNSAFQEGAIW